jgi:hypothetical protein
MFVGRNLWRPSLSPACGPLVEWGYRCDRRRWWPQVYVLVVLAACALVLVFFSRNFSGWPAAGVTLLKMVAVVQILGLAAATGGETATALAPLRNTEFAPLCALTGLNPASLVVGLCANRWLMSWSVWLLPLPLWAFAYTQGGVRWYQLLALGAWSVTVFLLEVALCVAGARAPAPASDKSAMWESLLGGFYGLMGLWLYSLPLVFVAVGPQVLLSQLGIQAAWLDNIFAWLMWLQPAPQIERALSTAATPGGFLAGWAIHTAVVVGICYLALRALQGKMFPNAGDPLSPEPRAAAPSRWTLTNRPPRLAGDPFYWKDAHFLLQLGSHQPKRWRARLMNAAVVLGLLVLWWQYRMSAAANYLMVGLVFVPVTLLTTVGLLFTIEFQDKTWTSLATLPVPRKVMVDAKLRAAMAAMQPLLPYFLVGVVMFGYQLPSSLPLLFVGAAGGALLLPVLVAHFVLLPSTVRGFLLALALLGGVLAVTGMALFRFGLYRDVVRRMEQYEEEA